ncbi:hypothetical protein V5799_025432 [Amblyomma americanum]|uniref:Uncharacterized protein n=1 Tax=Amblyomma americanum TaxID=6943 RepID=A0AAQ4E9E8_AMBAM
MRAPTRFTILACNTLLEKRTRQSTRTTSMYLLSLPNVWLDVVRSADLPEWNTFAMYRLCRIGIGTALCSTTDQSARSIVRSSCKSWTRNLSAV